MTTKIVCPETEMKFIGEQNCPDKPKHRVEVTTNAVTLADILPAFEGYLKAMGFVFEGHVDIVDEEE